MNLCIDIGNTQTKYAVFDRDELKEIILHDGVLDELLGKYKIRHAIISRTGNAEVPEKILKEKKIKAIFLSLELKLPIQILYKTPEILGTDRIAGSVAANLIYRNANVLKIDFGTCITYDFVNDKNQFSGGAISPGMQMRFKAMHNYTAKLPLVDPMHFTSFELIGTDTGTSVLSGVVNGIKAEVEGIIKEYKQRYANLKVVATGGDSGFFVTLLKSEIFARPYLVPEGLNRILNYNL